jgi:epoxide hydrolase-like predicted phosphatase
LLKYQTRIIIIAFIIFSWACYCIAVNKFPQGIDAVIFDLGGVLVDLSPQKTAGAFAQLAGVSPEDVFKLYASHAEFNAYEKGGINDYEFRDFVRKAFSVDATDTLIDACWNAMLLGFPEEKLNKLQVLKRYFRTVVLSNTNAIHLRFIEECILQGKSLSAFFHHAYYSHIVQLRKPDMEIYHHVLKNSRLVPQKTVFLDDNLENLEAASKTGIHTIHVTNSNQVLNLFEEYV